MHRVCFYSLSVLLPEVVDFLPEQLDWSKLLFLVHFLCFLLLLFLLGSLFLFRLFLRLFCFVGLGNKHMLVLHEILDSVAGGLCILFIFINIVVEADVL